ncbi:MAG: sigma-70 family RNA polymerase sigma factor [Candidatus Margulisbacteria bacterium]|nr:sigma-70 family RNA polymerase sigma factor [Candidatus Margulisiibacteriota bacterium]
MSLEEISNHFIAGEKEAFQALYEQTKDFLFRVIYKMVHNKEEAEDLMHDIYIKLFEKHNSYNKEKSSLKTWIYRLAVNHALNHIKRKRWFSGRLFKFLGPEQEDGPAEKTIAAEEVRLVNNALSQVKEDYRACIILKDFEDKSYQEIAEILNINIGIVKTRLNRGRNQLIKIYTNITSQVGTNKKEVS